MALESEKKKKNKETADFWRALVFLKPHWKIVSISIFCALVVGVAFTSGLSTMLPIIQVLIKGDTVQAWVDRVTVERRLGVKLADDPQHVVISSAKENQPAKLAGLERGEIQSVAGMQMPDVVPN